MTLKEGRGEGEAGRFPDFAKQKSGHSPEKNKCIWHPEKLVFPHRKHPTPTYPPTPGPPTSRFSVRLGGKKEEGGGRETATKWRLTLALPATARAPSVRHPHDEETEEADQSDAQEWAVVFKWYGRS